MPKKLSEIITDYRSDKLYTRPTEAGASTEDDFKDKLFNSRLEELLKFNNSVLITILVIIIVFVAFLGLLIWKYSSNNTLVISFVTGEAGGVYFGINKMHQLYKESVAAKLLIQMLYAHDDKIDKNKIFDSIQQILKPT